MRTRQEWLEMEKFCEGKTPKQVARELNCSVGAARQIMCRIYAKDYPPEGVPVRHRNPVNKIGFQKQEHRRIDKYIPVLQEMNDRTLQEVGDSLGITRERVRQLYDELNVERKSHFYLKHRFSREDVEAYVSGVYTKREAVEKMGLSYAGIDKLCEQYGIEPKFRPHEWAALKAVGLRRCCACKEVKPVSEFSHINRSCKPCAAARTRHYYQLRKDKHFLLLHNSEPYTYFKAGHHPSEPVWTTDSSEALIIKGSNMTNRHWFRLIRSGCRFVEIPNLNEQIPTSETGRSVTDSVSPNGAGPGPSVVPSGDSQAQRLVSCEGAAHC